MPSSAEHHPSLHDRVQALYQVGQLTEAEQLLSEALTESPTSELWNDWAAVQTAAGELLDAERGFRAALRLNPENAQASANFGALLFAQGRCREAAPHLHLALEFAPQENQTVLGEMLERCVSSLDSIAESVTPPSTPAVENSPALPEAAEVVRQWHPDLAYDQWFTQVFRTQVRTPGARLVVSWEEDSAWGLRAYNALALLECEYATQLLREIGDKNIAGDIAEFGIYQGWWMNFLFQTTEQLGLARRIYGFDSFEGLSEPHPEHDQSYWKKGQYACSFEQVSKNLSTQVRPRIKLVKGYFEKSLHSPDAQLAEKFAYVRIDCDIYEPALDCLRYLGPRLADGAVLVFDDWPHLRGFGEQRAFEEWLPTVPHLNFEFLFYGPIGHFYLRVHHKK